MNVSQELKLFSYHNSTFVKPAQIYAPTHFSCFNINFEVSIFIFRPSLLSFIIHNTKLHDIMPEFQFVILFVNFDVCLN